MRIAAIYDIHGNLPALEAVLDEVRRAKVDLVVVGGDVLPGPMPRESLNALLEFEIPTRFIYGNGDREVLARLTGTETDWYRAAPDSWREPIRWTAEQLDGDQKHLLSRWPPNCRIQVEGVGEAFFCHATPQSDIENVTRLTPDEHLVAVFEEAAAPLVVCGHTHMQFDRIIGQLRVVNAGSVGMPFGQPGAYWLLLGPDVQLRHTTFDLSSAVDRIRSTQYPQAETFATNNVLNPPTEKQALEMFSGSESK